MEEVNFNLQVLHKKIITLLDNVKIYNSKLLKQMSEIEEYSMTTCDQIWKDFELLVQSLKHRIQQFTSSLKLSTETVIKNFKKRTEENNLCENKLQHLALNLTELLSNCPANGEEKPTNYFDIDSECKALESKCIINQADDLSMMRVEYEAQFIDMYHKIPTMIIGKIYLTEDKECTPLSIESSYNTAICKHKEIMCQCNPPKLVTQSQWVTDEIDWISGITVTDNGHVFFCDRWEMSVKEYSPDGKMLKSYEMTNEPWDIYSISPTTIFVVMAWDYELAVLEKSRDADLFHVSRILDTDKRYVSISRVGSHIMATDRHTNVDILSTEATLLNSICIPALGEGMEWYPHRISPGISANTFLLLNWDIQTLLCYSLEGTLEFSHDLKWGGVESDASTVSVDKYGRIYVCDKYRLYTLTPEGLVFVLLIFEKCLDEDPRIFICNKQNFLYLSCYEDGNKYFKIFKIC